MEIDPAISIDELASILAKKSKKAGGKYGVRPKEERTWRGVVYMSRIEMEWHQLAELDPENVSIERQPRIELGADAWCKPDFAITRRDGERYMVDVKGAESRSFVRVKKLWKKYGLVPLHVIKKIDGRFCTTEIVKGKA